MIMKFRFSLQDCCKDSSDSSKCAFFPIQVYSFCPDTCVWKGEGSFECAGFNAGAVGLRDRIYILGGDYSPDEITDEVQVGEPFHPQKLPMNVLSHGFMYGIMVYTNGKMALCFQEDWKK